MHIVLPIYSNPIILTSINIFVSLMGHNFPLILLNTALHGPSTRRPIVVNVATPDHNIDQIKWFFLFQRKETGNTGRVVHGGCCIL